MNEYAKDITIVFYTYSLPKYSDHKAGTFTIGCKQGPTYLCAPTSHYITMFNFTCQLTVEGTNLDFRFSLIHYPGGVRYWVVIAGPEAYVTSFYFEKNDQGTWKLSDRYKTAPPWVYALEAQLAAAIGSHEAAQEN